MKKILLVLFIPLFTLGCNLRSGESDRADEDQVFYFGDTGIPDDYDEYLKDFSVNNDIIETYPSKFKVDVTEARDQKNCGACWAFTAVGVLSSKVFSQRSFYHNFSEQQQINCNTDMRGCIGGNMTSLRYYENHGPMESSCTGYDAKKGRCKFDCFIHNYRLKSYYTVNMLNVNDVKYSIFNHGAGYFRFKVKSDFLRFWKYGKPGQVYKPSSSAQSEGGHAVVIYGWDDEKQAWLCKNSWGVSGGPEKNGSFYITYDVGSARDLRYGMSNAELVFYE